MPKYNITANWDWKIPNDQGTPCCEIEDLLVDCSVTIDRGAITDIVVEQVRANWYEWDPARTKRVRIERDLPRWLAALARTAAKREANNQRSPLANAIGEAAQEAAYE